MMKRNLQYLLIVSIVLVLIATYFLYFHVDNSDGISGVCFAGKQCIEVEIMDEPRERARGLMYRESLDEDKGMLFIFPEEGDYGFWMKNMQFPIDIIWINSGKIVHIERDVPPCESEPCATYTPKKKAKYVLEVVANFTLENGIDPGSGVEFV